MKNILIHMTAVVLLLPACNSTKKATGIPVAGALKPVVTTEPVVFDTDDPAIWINRSDPSRSLVLGTDKETGGGIYAFNLQGKIVNKITGLQRPNNIDIAYALSLNGKPTDIAAFTERRTHMMRIISVPDMKPVDNGGISIFASETAAEYKDGMGIAFYTAPDKIYAEISRQKLAVKPIEFSF